MLFPYRLSKVVLASVVACYAEVTFPKLWVSLPRLSETYFFSYPNNIHLRLKIVIYLPFNLNFSVTITLRWKYFPRCPVLKFLQAVFFPIHSVIFQPQLINVISVRLPDKLWNLEPLFAERCRVKLCDIRPTLPCLCLRSMSEASYLFKAPHEEKSISITFTRVWCHFLSPSSRPFFNSHHEHWWLKERERERKKA